MAATSLTAARLRELFHYDPITGNFIRLSNGKAAGTLNACGYIVFVCDGRLMYAHRLAWLYMSGEMPKWSVDHINGSRSDNRWSNLRDVPHQLNCQNNRRGQGRAKMLGAVWNSRANKWRSVITSSGMQIHLGTFETAEQAHAAYVEAKRRLHAGCTI
jgi:hypothetical protein